MYRTYAGVRRGVCGCLLSAGLRRFWPSLAIHRFVKFELLIRALSLMRLSGTAVCGFQIAVMACLGPARRYSS